PELGRRDAVRRDARLGEHDASAASGIRVLLRSGTMGPSPAAARAPLHVISGASSDIGRAIALALAASERTVLALGRRVSVLKALARQAPERIDWLAGDLTKEAAMQAIKTRVARSSGVAALIHCAGEHAAGRIESSSPATLDRLYQVN